MDKLDKFISENARLFDDSEPDKGHFKRFTERLDRETVVTPFRINRGLSSVFQMGINLPVCCLMESRFILLSA